MMYGNYMQGDVKEMFNSHANKKESHEVSRWSTPENQQANFDVVDKILHGRTDIKTVLDVGCGLGDIRTQLVMDYEGIDIAAEVVKRADHDKIMEADILDFEPGKTYDAVIALGTFNMGVPWEKVKASLNKMHDLSNVITVCTISYIKEEELAELHNEGWSITTHPTAFNSGYGDRHVLTKTHNE